ncbi:hypothetical protein GF362_03900 [Candidatus Dojkabacteria bacterium]|nr:hypothetical protein [Candidatus Dojkabacteria bacterium]
MKKKILLRLLLVFAISLTISGCVNKSNDTDSKSSDIQPNPTETITITTAPVPTEISNEELNLEEQISKSSSITKTDNPGFTLDEDIHPDQLKEVYKLGELYITLTQKPSVNIPINAPNATYSGLLIGDNIDKLWEKLLLIQDSNETDKNNPYALWLEDNKLFLTIVDQNGAGSGEGILKLYSTIDGKTWIKQDCNYYVPEIGSPESLEKINSLTDIPEEDKDKLCNNVTLTTYPIN